MTAPTRRIPGTYPTLLAAHLAAMAAHTKPAPPSPSMSVEGEAAA